MRLLLEGCKKNDRESQRLLYQHYYAYAMSICLRYCRSIDEAKEIVNDGFIKFFHNIFFNKKFIIIIPCSLVTEPLIATVLMHILNMNQLTFIYSAMMKQKKL